MQEDQLTTWSARPYEREKVIKGLRKLEKISRDQKSKSYVVTENGEDEDSYGIFGEQDDPDYIWVGEGDLSEIYEESDLQEALATYQEVRRTIREQDTVEAHGTRARARISEGALDRFVSGVTLALAEYTWICSSSERSVPDEGRLGTGQKNALGCPMPTLEAKQEVPRAAT